MLVHIEERDDEVQQTGAQDRTDVHAQLQAARKRRENPQPERDWPAAPRRLCIDHLSHVRHERGEDTNAVVEILWVKEQATAHIAIQFHTVDLILSQRLV